jgi:hypothetical protein
VKGFQTQWLALLLRTAVSIPQRLGGAIAEHASPVAQHGAAKGLQARFYCATPVGKSAKAVQYPRRAESQGYVVAEQHYCSCQNLLIPECTCALKEIEAIKDDAQQLVRIFDADRKNKGNDFP